MLTLLLAAALALPPEGQALRQELLEMRQADQDPRNANDVGRMRELDRRHNARLGQVIERHGWPGTALVGQDGAEAAGVLALRADLPLQERCLVLLEAAVKRHDASSVDLAYLTDMVLIGEGKRQRYGTVFDVVNGHPVPLPLEAPAGLEERRKAMGLGPFQAELDHTARQLEASAGAEEAAAGDRPLRRQLLALAEADRQDDPIGSAHQARTEAMRGLLTRHGWPTPALVGQAGEDAAWWLVDHGDLRLRTQALPLLEAAVAHHATTGDRLAWLTDSVMSERDGKQRYGTLVRFEGGQPVPAVPIEDAARVDERRAALGLEPLQAMLRSMQKGPPSPESP